MITTLKRDQRCPACDGRVAIHVEKILETDHRGNDAPLAVARRTRAWSNLGPVGHFEAYVCKGCGWTELYACEVSELAEDGKTRGVRVVQRREG